ncbi:hypothetical protein [Euzebya rosea]|uniref:hypothetical protein n=1 Tax=Euzebya rosea TaxID=2052804 RepID=UPI000D3E9C2C|nr:hypothetical protein [Euzebya rosea]
MTDRRRGFSTREQLTALAPLLVVWALGIGALGLMLLQGAGDRAVMFLDPTHVGSLPWYVGTYAEIGAALWAVSATAAAFGWMLTREAGRPAAASFLRGGSLVCLMMLTDTVLTLHAAVFPRYIGVDKRLVVAAYGVATVTWLLRSRAEVLRTRWQVLAAAFAALGLSVVIDVVADPTAELGVVLEDAPKFLGILAMTTYFTLTTRDVARSVIRQAAAQPPTSGPGVHTGRDRKTPVDELTPLR